MEMKKKKIDSKIINDFFSNKDVTIVGHTLDADLNSDVLNLFGFQGEVKCRKVDICPIFKPLFPNERPGLANQCKVILGK